MAAQRQDLVASTLRRDLGDAVVASLREVTGRGPVSTRVVLTDDSLTVFMEDSLSVGELELVKTGFREQVLAMRSAYQQAMRPKLSLRISHLVNREIRAFMSANHTDPDVAVEIFVFGPSLDSDVVPGP